MEENYEDMCDELAEIKDSCRDACLKVILETGALATAENIRKASILALYSNADLSRLLLEKVIRAHRQKLPISCVR